MFFTSLFSTDDGDPYYPVPNPRNQELYAKYQVALTSLKGRSKA